MEELDECAFLFRIQSGANSHLLGGIAFDKGDIFCLLSWLERNSWLGDLLLGRRHLCWVQIFLGLLQLLSTKDRFGESGFSCLAGVRLVEIAVDGDYAIRPRHLQLVVDVTGARVERRKGGPSEDGMVRALERNHFEGERF